MVLSLNESGKLTPLKKKSRMEKSRKNKQTKFYILSLHIEEISSRQLKIWAQNQENQAKVYIQRISYAEVKMEDLRVKGILEGRARGRPGAEV